MNILVISSWHSVFQFLQEFHPNLGGVVSPELVSNKVHLHRQLHLKIQICNHSVHILHCASLLCHTPLKRVTLCDLMVGHGTKGSLTHETGKGHATVDPH